jgi:hypothetical protein
LAKTLVSLKDYPKAIEVVQQAETMDGLNEKESQSLQQLLKEAKTKQAEPEGPVESSIKCVNHPISIRKFIKGKSLGVGIFSENIVVQHKITNEDLALKILEKKAAANLA